MRLPPGGIPGVDDPDSVIELVPPVYGFADAPRAWNVSVTRYLRSLGLKQSSLDPCVMYLHNDAKKLCGVLAIHVDDLVRGGSEKFYEQVII